MTDAGLQKEGIQKEMQVLPWGSRWSDKGD